MKLLQTIPKFEPLKQAHRARNFSRDDIKRSKVIVFYFWSSDCSLCKKWPQFVDKLQASYGDSVQCIVVHDGQIDQGDVPKVSGATSIIDADKQLATSFNVRHYPAIYIFDTEHLLRFYQSGSSETRMLLRRIEKFIDPL